MNRKLQWTAVLVLMAWSAAASAQPAYDYLGYKMLNTRDYRFRYYLDARALSPAGISLAEVETATKAAFQTWEDVACAYPAFAYAGRSTSNASIVDVRDSNDQFNVSTIWVTNTTDPYYAMALASGQSPTGTIPLTYGGYLYQCDIYVNAVDFRWTTLATTDPKDKFRDLQTALTHEVGHCMGLADVGFPDTAVMNPAFPVGSSRRVLDAQDVQQVCEYYPENGAVGSPCSASDPCSPGLSCIPFKDGANNTLYEYCSKGCQGVTNGECPSPFVCQTYSGISGFTKACLAVPNQNVTQVGKQCNGNPDCGSATGICQPPTGLPSGGTAWVDGYCQQPCSAGSTTNTCPAGSVCVRNADPTGTQDRCLKPCRPGTGDCRPGYTCAPLAEGDVCIPPCYTDPDCNGGTTATTFACRTCDRICVENRSTGRSVGDPCTTTSQCGPGQICFFINNHPQGVCTQTCNTATCICPTGTVCKDVGADRVCMKECAAGTCTSPLQCNPVGQSYSCTAACRTRNDCPSGYECYPTGCQDPRQGPDGGCTLCGSDGGTQPPPPPTDGGSGGGGGGGPGGCGCGEAPGSALVLFGLLGLLLWAGGRRSWHRR